MRKFNVKYGGMTYKVEPVEDLCNLDGDALHGHVDHTVNVIKVRTSDIAPVQAVTLWHELMHVVLQHSGREHDEGLVECLAYGLNQLVSENPQLLNTFKTLTR